MEIREGRLGGTLPFFALGAGPPLVVCAGLTPTHANPKGLALRFETQTLKPFAAHFTVHEVNRRPLLPPGTTMADIATDYADALDAEFGEPVDVIGISTGGSVAQQLAIDHGRVVKRLVLAATAYRLGPHGKEAQRRMLERVRDVRVRDAYREVGRAGFSSAIGRFVGGWGAWLLGPLVVGRMTSPDMAVTIEAEDRFDAGVDLGRITVATLVVASERDRFYSPDLFRETAQRIPNARLKLYPGKGHVGTIAGKQFARDTLDFLGVH